MVRNIRKLGRVIYLHSSLKGILTTIKQHPNAARKIKKRPLLQDMEKARALYDARLPLYREVADYEINVEGRKSSEIAQTIKSLLIAEGAL